MALISATIEVEGYRIGLLDNGDGSFSLYTTTATAGTDPTVEFQGMRLRIHPTADTVVVGVEVYTVYAFVTVSV